MKLGKVIGRVVSEVKVDSFEGLKLLLVEQVNEKLEKIGEPFVAVDTIRSNIGQIVYFEVSKEASMVLENFMNPCDAAIVGIVDEINLQNKL